MYKISMASLTAPVSKTRSFKISYQLSHFTRHNKMIS